MILLGVGLVTLLGFYVPDLTTYIKQIFSYIPLKAYYVSIIITLVGLLFVVVGAKKSKMGKYYRYY